MDEVNLGNMPQGQLYEYADGCYVWKIMRTNGTRGANYLRTDPEPREYTEVFRMENDGKLGIVWSGRLETNPGVFNEKCLDSQGRFSIFSYDQDTAARFSQSHELIPAPLELQIDALESEVAVLKHTQEKLNNRKFKF